MATRDDIDILETQERFDSLDRRNEIGALIELCPTMLLVGEWRAVLHAGRWRVECQGCRETITHGANILRMLAPHSDMVWDDTRGWAERSYHAMQDAVPNILPTYVWALRVLFGNYWWNWLRTTLTHPSVAGVWLELVVREDEAGRRRDHPQWEERYASRPPEGHSPCLVVTDDHGFMTRLWPTGQVLCDRLCPHPLPIVPPVSLQQEYVRHMDDYAAQQLAASERL